MTRCILVRDPRIAAGGFETWVETLAQELPARGVSVTVLVPGSADAVRERLGQAEILTIAARDAPLEQAAHVVRSLEQLASCGDRGVFFTMAYPYINIAGLNLGGGPWIAVPVLHGRHPSAYEWIAAGPPAKIVVPAADYARVVRHELRRRIRWFRALGRVVVIPHGVQVPSIDEKPARPPGASLEAVALTRLDEDMKRPFDLIRIAQRAAERAVPLRLTIAGVGPAEARMRAEAGDNVVFVGAVPHDRVPAFLRDADVLISTSESEAFGLSIAEALAAGCAVVTADIPGAVRELVNSETGVRVPVGDIDRFVDALEGLHAGDPRAMGRAGHALVARGFSSARMADRYAALIGSLERRVHPNRTWRAPDPLIESPAQLTLPPILTRLRRRFHR